MKTLLSGINCMFIVLTPSFQASYLSKAKRTETQIQKNKEIQKQTNKKSGFHFTTYFLHSIIRTEGKVCLILLTYYMRS